MRMCSSLPNLSRCLIRCYSLTAGDFREGILGGREWNRVKDVQCESREVVLRGTVAVGQSTASRILRLEFYCRNFGQGRPRQEGSGMESGFVPWKASPGKKEIE